MNLVYKAMEYATEKHAGQVRKYTGEPYITHPMRVALLVASVGADNETIAAAILHDVVEDTEATTEGVAEIFGAGVAELVASVTDASRPGDGNRKVRKAIDRDHLSKACPAGKTIKLADLIDNTSSIAAHDPSFARVYLAEKRELLPHLAEGHSRLFALARRLAEETDK